MSALLSLLQVELRAADGHLMPVLNEVLYAVLERQQPRATVDKGDAVDRERALEGCHLEQLVEDDIGIGIAAHVDDDTHTLAAGLVVDIGDSVNLAFLDEVGDILDKLLLVDAIRNLGNDNLIVLVAALNLGLGPHDNTSTTCGISVANTLQTIDIRSRGEVRSRNILHQSVEVDVGIVNICAASIDNLIEVMGRDVCGHTHGNTVASVD